MNEHSMVWDNSNDFDSPDTISSEKISMLDYSKRNTRIFKLLNIILKPIYAVQKELVRIVQEG